ncbi:uncharacterized protein [Anabrus simplex]|uniref:uncharacterized protein n=1 Tax=Anabrus simplex TaxID=316456 RepID=UPI0035A3442F
MATTATPPTVNEHGGLAACCSFQNSLAPPEYRQWRRINGLQLPLHPQQVAGWLALLGFGAATFFVLIPALGTTLRTPLLAILGILFVIHVASHLTALLLDPADPHLRQLKTITTVPEFDRSKHAHVIENGRCHLCNIRTLNSRTKHCSVCNKCVERFDHHCKWLNHCIGGRNYIPFVICVVSAVAASLVVLAVSIAELVLYHIEPSWLSPWEISRYNGTLEEKPFTSISVFPLEDTIFLVVIGCLGLLAAITAGLLLHLCFFHVYISILGITTYEYIRSYRQISGNGRNNSVAPSQNGNHQQAAVSEINRRCSKTKLLYCCFTPPPDTLQHQQTTLEFQTSSRRCCHRRPEPSDGHSISEENEGQHCPSYRKPPQDMKNNSREEDQSSCWYLTCMRSQYERTENEVSERLGCCSSTQKVSPSRSGSEGYCGRGTASRKLERMQIEESGITIQDSEELKAAGEPCRLSHQWWKSCPCLRLNLSRESIATGSTVRCNQVRPSIDPVVLQQTTIPTIVEKIENKSSTLTPKKITTTLPALGPPARRRLRNVAELKELSEALAFVQQPVSFPDVQTLRNAFTSSQRRQQRMKSLQQQQRTKSPRLSPIRESGLSNPSSPQLSEGATPPPTPPLSNDEPIFTVRAPRLRSGLWTTIDQSLVAPP